MSAPVAVGRWAGLPVPVAEWPACRWPAAEIGRRRPVGGRRRSASRSGCKRDADRSASRTDSADVAGCRCRGSVRRSPRHRLPAASPVHRNVRLDRCRRAGLRIADVVSTAPAALTAASASRHALTRRLLPRSSSRPRPPPRPRPRPRRRRSPSWRSRCVRAGRRACGT